MCINCHAPSADFLCADCLAAGQSNIDALAQGITLEKTDGTKEVIQSPAASLPSDAEVMDVMQGFMSGLAKPPRMRR